MIKHKFQIANSFKNKFSSKNNNFKTIIGEIVFYRTYSRNSESWAETILRCVEGNIAIVKNHYINNHIFWDEEHWQIIAKKMCYAIYKQKFIPSGRNLWASGTELIDKFGSLPLNNCAFVSVVQDGLAKAACNAFIMLMNGCGVGFDTNIAINCVSNDNNLINVFIIPDSREGWQTSLKLLFDFYLKKGSIYHEYDYSLIRPKGSVIKTFGGVASGPEPLKLLHQRIHGYFKNFITKQPNYTSTRLIVDIFNSIGVCVVSGNVRRSALIALGDVNDKIFLDLKNYDLYPERAEIGYMSNNSVLLNTPTDFLQIPAIVERIYNNSDIGVINMMNVKKYGRIGKPANNDAISGCNPCGEIMLESNELCNLVNTYPTNCKSMEEWLSILKLATTFATNVSLLPTNDLFDTNKVILKNHKIGISIGGLACLFDNKPISELIYYFRKGYAIIDETNTELAKIAGIRKSASLTTIKPDGSIGFLAGCIPPGIHFPVAKYQKRRIRFGKNDKDPLIKHLISCGVPYNEIPEQGLIVFDFPIAYDNVRESKNVNIWEQFSYVKLMQKEFVDNSVSVTIYYDKDETDKKEIERVLALSLPHLKTISMANYFKNEKKYPLIPIEEISKEEYDKLVSAIKWQSPSKLKHFDSIGEKYCSTDKCLNE